jgi:hypothetical protein
MSLPLAHYRIGDNHDIYDTIEARLHAEAQSRNPERRGGGVALDHFSP